MVAAPFRRTTGVRGAGPMTPGMKQNRESGVLCTPLVRPPICHESHRKKNFNGTRTAFDVSIFQLPPSFTKVSHRPASLIGTRYVTVLVLMSSGAFLHRTSGIISLT